MRKPFRDVLDAEYAQDHPTTEEVCKECGGSGSYWTEWSDKAQRDPELAAMVICYPEPPDGVVLFRCTACADRWAPCDEVPIDLVPVDYQGAVEEIHRWMDSGIPSWPELTPTNNKIREEMKEYLDSGSDDELVDVFVTIVFNTRLRNLNFPAMVQRKTLINAARSWEWDEERKVYHHV